MHLTKSKVTQCHMETPLHPPFSSYMYNHPNHHTSSHYTLFAPNIFGFDMVWDTNQNKERERERETVEEKEKEK